MFPKCFLCNQNSNIPSRIIYTEDFLLLCYDSNGIYYGSCNNELQWQWWCKSMAKT